MMKRIIPLLFPLESVSIVPRNRSNDLEVNGLPKGFVPQNCEVLHFGEELHGNSRRTHYLLKVDTHLVFLSVCFPEYGDSQFALIRGMAQVNSEAGDELIRFARNSIALVATAPALKIA
ncbi:MAG: hypothetical protein C4516_00750 [Oxalobacter sp.]|nr:MAG: hypothetical protein C4516_00750 [Oxalobacter sp.]